MQQKVGGRLLVQTWVGPSGNWNTLSTHQYVGTYFEMRGDKAAKGGG